MSSNVMNHLGQCVTDLERSRPFYVDAFGFDVLARARRFPTTPSDRLLRLQPPIGHDRAAICAGTGSSSSCSTSPAPAPPAPVPGRTMNEPGSPTSRVSVDDIDETCRRVVEVRRRGARTTRSIGGGIASSSAIPTASSSSCCR